MKSIAGIALVLVVMAGCSFAERTNSAAQPAAFADSGVATYVLSGNVVGAAGGPVPAARVSSGTAATTADSSGTFHLRVPVGNREILISAAGYSQFSVQVSISADTDLTFELQSSATTTVTAQVENSATAATQRNFEANELWQSNPGQPGVPVALPGYPAETASGGVKAPQYFAPGVAGDHGEPIAQYIRVGNFLFPNNLPANAHGNGYADPNLLVSNTIGFVESDAGAFDVRHGNNAVDLAVGYGLVPRLEPFMQMSVDPRNYDLVSGLSPSNPQTAAWLGVEVAAGDGFLNFPERRRQYKVNGERSWLFGHHLLTLFGAGYYGQSRLPGLVPINVPVPDDTIDPRQGDRTHTELLVACDTWEINPRRELQFSEYFRSYGLSLKSDFGDGLIRQSEFRTVSGGNTSFNQRINPTISFQGGLDFRRDAPRNGELARADANGIFDPVTRNNFVISDLAPYASIYGSLSRFFTYSVGARRDEVSFSNTDLLFRANSYQAHSGLTSPRGTISFRFPGKSLPTIAFSSGEAFHTNDPRIGLGTGRGTVLATSHANQLVATESVFGTQFRLALARVSNSQELAKIDPDTGLQENLGPSLIHSLTFSMRRKLSFASVQATFARANTTDPLTRLAVPEAPRLIYDFSATSIRLPWRMQASGGIEYVGRKPLGDGFTAVPVREVRGAFTRSFNNGLEAGFHFLAASGYTGQTLETLQLPDETAPIERVVGVRQTSYAGIRLTYHFRRR